ncbi:MAG: FRG domain-containing protein [Bryobacterales bacterium]|nr:FRG domain-containing protein [Bryobacterales bacterium]
MPSIDRPLRTPEDGNLIERDLAGSCTQALVQQLCRNHELDPDDALGFLQHYGLPTGVLDFTEDPHVALAFAAPGRSRNEGFVAIMPTNRLAGYARVIDYAKSKYFLERERKQRAFGLLTEGDSGQAIDLKDVEVARELGVQWFGVRFSPETAARYHKLKQRIMADRNDPYVGLLRLEITWLVCRLGKLDDRVAQLYAASVPKAPVIGKIRAMGEKEAIINLMAVAMPSKAFDPQFEECMSYLKWSARYPEVTPVGVMFTKRNSRETMMFFPDSFHGYDRATYKRWRALGSPCPLKSLKLAAD